MNKEILLIDDEEICIDSVKLMLIHNDYDLICFERGLEALEYINSNYEQVDVILLDLMLEDISGVEILEKLKANAQTKKITVIVQTGSQNSNDISRCFELGAKTCIYKPFKKSTLIEAIEVN